jgi:4a-hydroxytetrahydrobiopterin dehydratase
MERLTQQQVEAALEDLDDWHQSGDALVKTYRFHDFVGSVGFVNSLAEVAESLQHHPDIDIRYNKVTLTLSTHSAGGLTAQDIALARQADHCTH